MKWSMTSIDQQQSYEIIYNRIQFKQLPSFISNVISMSRFFLRKFSSLKYFVDENFRLKINIDENFRRRIFSYLGDVQHL